MSNFESSVRRIEELELSMRDCTQSLAENVQSLALSVQKHSAVMESHKELYHIQIDELKRNISTNAENITELKEEVDKALGSVATVKWLLPLIGGVAGAIWAVITFIKGGV